MTKLRIEIDQSQVNASRSRGTIGGIWFVYNGYCFPSENWSDFVAYLLGSWIVDLRRFSDASFPGPVQLSFMEGPWHVIVARNASGRLALYFVRSGLNDETLVSMDLTRQALERLQAEGEVIGLAESSLENVLQTINDCVTRLVAVCRSAGYVPEDVQDLERFVLGGST